MKRTILLIGTLLNVFSAISQQFSVLYDYESFANDGTTIIKSNSNYYSSHAAGNLETWQLTTLVAKHYSDGSQDWSISLTDSVQVFGQAVYTGLGILSDMPNQEFWVLTSRYVNEDMQYTPAIFRFQYSGEIIDTIFIDELTHLNLVNYSGVKANNSIYLLNQEHNESTVFIVKCDLAGSYITHWDYFFGYGLVPYFISDVEDGLVIGGRIIPSPNIEFWQQFLCKLTYNGDIEWIDIYDNNGLTSLGAINALPMNNGNVLFASTATSGQPLLECFRPMIGEIDDVTGDTLWTKKYFSADSSYTLLNFKRLSSGEYIGVGECWQPLNFPDAEFVVTAFIMKLDSEYNLLWKRMYIPEGFASIGWPEATCRLNDFVENEDGGITALGRAFTYTGTGPQSGYIQDSWLLRVDSEGCLVSGCAVDITEYESEQFLFVYPNPASEQLNIQFPFIDKWQVSIYNMQGALVKEENTYQLLQHSIDIKELPSGVYTLLCRNKEGKVFTQKMMKQ